MTIIETNRLILRELTMNDTANLMRIFADPVAMQYYPSTKTEEEAKQWIERNMNRYREHSIGLWGAILKDSGQFVGQVGLVPQEVDGVNEIEIGYLFIREYWGRGLATEGASACRDYGFNELGLNRLISIINPQNLPSIKVAERVGMKLEKQTIKWERECLIYAIKKGEE